MRDSEYAKETILWVYPKATRDVVDGSIYLFFGGPLLNPQMHS